MPDGGLCVRCGKFLRIRSAVALRCPAMDCLPFYIVVVLLSCDGLRAVGVVPFCTPVMLWPCDELHTVVVVVVVTVVADGVDDVVS